MVMLSRRVVVASMAVVSLATTFSVVRVSSTFIVFSAASLLLQAETAKAAPATRIRARIQNSLDCQICLAAAPPSQIARTIVGRHARLKRLVIYLTKHS